MDKEQLIEMESMRCAMKRVEKEGGSTEEICEILEEERQREQAKVEEGEEWCRSLAPFVEALTGQELIGAEYQGFNTGRRTFKLLCS